ncbi:MAG: tRNA (adenosine(37)-N6)-dimethylallyltransferase MiaA [Patescibacteria group bacterium]|jgi:tRNA dimethylallyltransferase
MKNKRNYRNLLINVVGPTASGKSALALSLAKKFNGVIICADSRQVYKYMNIGTNKPSRAERKVVPHYGLDLVTPNQVFTLSDFMKYADRVLTEVWQQGKLPFIVGGTGLYVTALAEGYSLSTAGPDASLRQKLVTKTTTQLASLLQKLSPAAAQSLDLKNRHRVIRALEQTKHHSSSQTAAKKPRYHTLQLGASIDRAKLYKRINQRVDLMVKQGLIAEVKRLAKRYRWSRPAMSGIGYRQIGQWLSGDISRDEAIELIKRDTRHYAKRQLTWYRKRTNIHWIKNRSAAAALCRRFVAQNK